MDTSPSIVIRLKQSYCQQIGKIKRVIGLMPASFITGLIDTLDLDANPRSSRLGGVTEAIQVSIRNDETSTHEKLFPFKSKGILLAASQYEELDRGRYRLQFIDKSTEGILDGGHNTLAIGVYVLSQAEKACGKAEPSRKSIAIWDDFKATWNNLRDDVDQYLDRIHNDRESLIDEGIGVLDFEIPVELLLPSSDEVIDDYRGSLLEICDARNNNAQLTQGTKGNQEGLFDSIKKYFMERDPNLANDISWKTNDGGRIKSERIIALSWIPLSLVSWTSGKDAIVDAPSPVSIYSGKMKCQEKYLALMRDERVSVSNGGPKKGLKDPEIGSALKVAADMPELYDKVYQLFPSYYSGSYGKINAVKSMKNKREEYTTPFLHKKTDKPVPDGFVYPLVYGLRALMGKDERTGRIIWLTDPFAFVESKKFKDVVAQYSGVIQQSDYDPQKVGKGSYSYTSAENAVKLAYLLP